MQTVHLGKNVPKQHPVYVLMGGTEYSGVRNTKSGWIAYVVDGKTYYALASMTMWRPV